MTVNELIKILKEHPKDMLVTRVVSFENVDEFGNCESEPVENVIVQHFVDVQFGDSEEKELMIY